MMNSEFDNLFLRSDAFPKGTLLDSYYDRELTCLSDRGRASNMIGDRWSDVAFEYLVDLHGQEVEIPRFGLLTAGEALRLDSHEDIARIASRHKLQNPDYLFTASKEDHRIHFAVDAKFSVETAKAAQVSAETMHALVEGLEFRLIDVAGQSMSQWQFDDGLFISPDMPLTHYMLERGHGRYRAKVTAQQALLVPVSPVLFLKPVEGAKLLGVLAAVDGYRQDIRTNMLLAMYYFRLVRASYGAYERLNTPVFGPKSAGIGTETELEQRTIHMARNAQSAWDIVLHWDSLAEQVERQRQNVYAAMPFPIANSELRDRVLRESGQQNVTPPSINRIRRQIGAWYRSRFDDQLGVVLPPIVDIGALLNDVERVARDVAPEIPQAIAGIIDTAITDAKPLPTETASIGSDILLAQRSEDAGVDK